MVFENYHYVVQRCDPRVYRNKESGIVLSKFSIQAKSATRSETPPQSSNISKLVLVICTSYIELEYVRP